MVRVKQVVALWIFNLVTASVALEESDLKYEQCGVNSSCIGMPSGCVSSKNCKYLVSVHETDEHRIRFENFVSDAEENMWYAVALSKDNKMGDDSVTACIAYSSTNLQMENSWNQGKKNVPSEMKGVHNFTARFTDKTLSFAFDREQVTEDTGHTFDLRVPHFLLLAYGRMRDGGKKAKHQRSAMASDVAISFQEHSVIGGAGAGVLVKLHGSLMTIAWLGAVSVAILLPRHFKQDWNKPVVLGTAAWFTVHRGLMLVAVLLAAIAMACIVVHVDGLRFENAHPYWGLAANVLMLAQPIMALFRCDPGSENRYIFNWCHRIVGNVAHITAVTTIYLSTATGVISLGSSFIWVLSAYVIVYIVTLILLEILPKLMAGKGGQLEISMSRDSQDPLSAGSEEKRFRKLVLLTFSIAVTFTLAYLLYCILRAA